jgi:hypothetical protein
MMLSWFERMTNHSGTEIRVTREILGSSEEYWTMRVTLIQPTTKGLTNYSTNPVGEEHNELTFLSVPTNLVPAVAVIRGGLALSVLNGPRESVGCLPRLTNS